MEVQPRSHPLRRWRYNEGQILQEDRDTTTVESFDKMGWAGRGQEGSTELSRG